MFSEGVSIASFARGVEVRDSIAPETWRPGFER